MKIGRRTLTLGGILVALGLRKPAQAIALIETPRAVPDYRTAVIKIGRHYLTPEGPLLSIEGTPYVHWRDVVEPEMLDKIEMVELGDPYEIIAEYVEDKVRTTRLEGDTRPGWAQLYQW